MAQIHSAPAGLRGGRTVERASQGEARRIARRSFLRVSVFAGVTLAVGTLLSGFLGFFNKLKPVGFGGVVTVAATRIPRLGDDPARIAEGKFWLVNLQGAQGDVLDVGGTGGLMALYWKCPHLGCSVPWNPTFDGGQVAFPGVVGWFRCPCHGSTYSRAGIRVFGPSPRPLDTMALTLNPDGSINVNTGAITSGGPDNPLRAVPYSA
ncbi:MAG TPA: Rieske 2Fe-2S domain-containing protein [Tepidiformaceae bacterium]|nr:Rieske 2Fe-2S domain-containing protein [Tepidiformaceae bacterium]